MKLKGAILRCRPLLLTTLILYSLTSTYYAYGANNIKPFKITNEVGQGATRLLNEAADGVITPFTLKDNNLFWTTAVVGAIGLTYAFDSDIRDSVQSRKNTTLNKATDAGSLVGNPYLHLGLSAVTYAGGIIGNSPKWKEAGEMMGEALILADVATIIIKEGTGRGRPNTAERKDEFKPFAFKNNYDSFPSLHTSSSFALAAVVSRVSGDVPTAILAYSAAAFVGYSRLYQNKHWASDIILAAAIGELTGRVVTTYHVKNSNHQLNIIPILSGNSALVSLNYRYRSIIYQNV